jgi:hypothetical protein
VTVLPLPETSSVSMPETLEDADLMPVSCCGKICFNAKGREASGIELK